MARVVAALDVLAQNVVALGELLYEHRDVVLTIAAAWGVWKASVIALALFETAAAGVSLLAKGISLLSVKITAAAGAALALYEATRWLLGKDDWPSVLNLFGFLGDAAESAFEKMATAIKDSKIGDAFREALAEVKAAYGDETSDVVALVVGPTHGEIVKGIRAEIDKLRQDALDVTGNMGDVFEVHAENWKKEQARLAQVREAYRYTFDSINGVIEGAFKRWSNSFSDWVNLLFRVLPQVAGMFAQLGNLRSQGSAFGGKWWESLGTIGSILPTFHGGGTVPGPIGTPVPIMALAGETVNPIGAGGGITVNISPVVYGDFNSAALRSIREQSGVIGQVIQEEMRRNNTLMGR